MRSEQLNVPIDTRKSGEAREHFFKQFIQPIDPFDPKQPFWNGTTPDIKWPE